MCSFTRNNIKFFPKLRDSTNGQKFIQSYNISPSQITPILFCERSDVLGKCFIDNRFIQPMKWGLVPSWYKKEPGGFKLKTHNAKIETIFEKPVYKSSLVKGYRCVVVINGYYEWSAKMKNKPHYIKSKSEPVLYLAGIFDRRNTDDDQSYSYTIITEKSQGKVEQIHHRSPTILRDEKEVDLWLDSENVSAESAVKYLQKRPWCENDLEMFPVSTMVNNSSNNDSKCIVKLDEFSDSLKTTTLTRWLNWEPQTKKPKLEEK